MKWVSELYKDSVLEAFLEAVKEVIIMNIYHGWMYIFSILFSVIVICFMFTVKNPYGILIIILSLFLIIYGLYKFVKRSNADLEVTFFETFFFCLMVSYLIIIIYSIWFSWWYTFNM